MKKLRKKAMHKRMYKVALYAGENGINILCGH